MRLYGIDIETDDPHLNDKGASWVYSEGEIIVTGLYIAKTGTKKALAGNGGKVVKDLLLSPEVTLVGTNIQYDLGWLCYEHKLKASEIKCGLIDVAIAEAAIDEYQLYTLDALAWKYLKERKQAEPLKALCERLGFKGDFRKHLKRLWDAGYEKEIKDYVISDADQPVRIWEKQLAILTLKPNAKLRGHTWMGDPVYNEDFSGAMEPLIVNFKLIKIVLGMKQRGVRIDMEKRKKNYEFLKSIQEKLQIEFDEKYSLEVKKEKIVRISKKGKIKESETTTETHPVNFNSPKQLAALFDKEKVPYRCKIRIKGFSDGYVLAGNELWEERKRLKEIFNGVRVQKGQLVLYVPKQYASRTNDDLHNMGYITTCNPNIDKKALDTLKKKYGVAKAITDLKQVTSIIDKFLGPKFDRFIVKHGENNYRVHADFKIVGARQTGRLSSANPNLQQIPSKTVLFSKTKDEIKLYKLCRETIIPDDGYILAKADYSGQENVLMAHFAVGNGAEEIRYKYNENPDLDFHKYMGEVTGLYEEYGADIGRKYAKNCSFGLGYGMQLQTMMETFGWSKEEAERITALYHDGAPFVKSTMDKVSKVIVQRGYIKTLGGRHCHLDRHNGEVNTRNAYKGFNKLIQGSAADMTKKAMVDLDEKGLLDIFLMYLTVHDELVFGIPKKAAAIKRLPLVQEVMQNTYKMSVPIRVEPELGTDWGHVKGRTEKKKKIVKGKETMVERILTTGEFLERAIKEYASKTTREVKAV